jgi:hypothetical protein
MLRLRLEDAPLGSRNVEWSGLEQRRAEMETSPEVAALPPLRSRAPSAVFFFLAAAIGIPGFLERPEIPDRVVSSAAAGIPGCDLVIVTSRRKEGWARGVAVFTSSACDRIGDPVERMVTGRLRTLYPLTEHKDFEAVRKSVRYDLPGENDGSTVT